VTGKKLAAYERVHLSPGESTVVEFALRPHDLAVLDPENRWSIMPGKYELWVGPVSTDGIHGDFSVE
jgi:beta-glucosidase